MEQHDDAIGAGAEAAAFTGRTCRHGRRRDLDVHVHRSSVHADAHLGLGACGARADVVEARHGTRGLRPFVGEPVEQRACHEQRREQVAARRIELAAQIRNAVEKLGLARDDAAEHLRSRQQRIFLSAPQSRFHLLRVLPARPGQNQREETEQEQLGAKGHLFLPPVPHSVHRLDAVEGLFDRLNLRRMRFTCDVIVLSSRRRWRRP